MDKVLSINFDKKLFHWNLRQIEPLPRIADDKYLDF